MYLIRSVSVLILLIGVGLHSTKLLGTIHLQEMMTPEEQKKTGLAQLSDDQKDELDSWISDKFTPKATTTTAAASPQTIVTLVQNNSNGSELIFSNNASYQIAPQDQSKTSSWLSPIIVRI